MKFLKTLLKILAWIVIIVYVLPLTIVGIVFIIIFLCVIIACIPMYLASWIALLF